MSPISKDGAWHSTLLHFREIWCVDAEFLTRPGCQPEVRCIVAKELRSQVALRVWADELQAMRAPPYSIGADSLFVAFAASAELRCHLALGWALPVRILDLHAEYRAATNGRVPPGNDSLLEALSHFGIPAIGVAQKAAMRDLAMRGGTYSASERRELLDYCESDVNAVAQLLAAMAGNLDLYRAVLRGRYLAAVAHMEATGIPVDGHAHDEIVASWDSIRVRLIAEIDSVYGVYDGTRFRRQRFVEWLRQNRLAWPLLADGAPALDADTFKQLARVYPSVAPLQQLRSALSSMRRSNLAIGPDGRNRAPLAPFRSKTGRNQPSTTAFIFGASAWLRGLIRPTPGYGLAYIDWAQQEFGVGAALSEDAAMRSAYESGDAYLAFAKMAGAAPPEATKRSHKIVREQFKTTCGLGVLYGMGARSLGVRLGESEARAKELLALHRRVFAQFWRWTENLEAFANFSGGITTVFGWPLYIDRDTKPGTVRNFPLQANGAEILRLACCLATEAGIAVCAPVHDALLIEAPADELEEAIGVTRRAMSDASAIVLDGFRLRTDVKRVLFPNRFTDDRGAAFWDKVWLLIHADGHRHAHGVAPQQPTVAPAPHRTVYL